MNKKDYLDLYAKGWIEGNVEDILNAVSETFSLDDPNAGIISKANFRVYFEEMKKMVVAMRGNANKPIMEVSDLVISEEAGVLTAWVWWSVPGTKKQGSGLIKVGDTGILSDRLAYYTKLPT